MIFSMFTFSTRCESKICSTTEHMNIYTSSVLENFVENHRKFFFSLARCAFLCNIKKLILEIKKTIAEMLTLNLVYYQKIYEEAHRLKRWINNLFY